MKNETDALNDAIIILKDKRRKELELLKEKLNSTIESLKPINIIKSTFREISASSEIKSNVIDNLISIGTGFITKKHFLGDSHNPVKKVLGTILQFAITNVVSKHSDKIKSVGMNFLHGFKKHSKDSNSE